MLKVLVVDDQTPVCNEFSRLLSTYDVQVSQSKTIEQARKQCQLKKDFNLIITDLWMTEGKLAGETLVRQLAPLCPQSVFIVFTANPHDRSIESAMRKLVEEVGNCAMFTGKELLLDSLPELLATYDVANESEPISDLPSDLDDYLRDFSRRYSSLVNQRAFDEGKLFSEAREKIESVRKILTQSLESSLLSDADKASLQKQYDNLKSFWGNLVEKALGGQVKSLTIHHRWRYYNFFKDPERYPYLDKLKSSAFLKFMHDSLSEDDRRYLWLLLVNPQKKELTDKEITTYLNLKKRFSKASPVAIPPTIIYDLAHSPYAQQSEFLNQVTTQITSSLQDSTNLDLKTLESKLKALESHFGQTYQVKETLLKKRQEQASLALKEIKSADPIKPQPQSWYRQGLAHWFNGSLSDGISALDQAIVQKICYLLRWNGGNNFSFPHKLTIISIVEKHFDFEDFKLYIEYLLLAFSLNVTNKIVWEITSDETLRKIESLLTKWETELMVCQEDPPEPNSHEDAVFQLILDLNAHHTLRIVKHINP